MSTQRTCRVDVNNHIEKCNSIWINHFVYFSMFFASTRGMRWKMFMLNINIYRINWFNWIIKPNWNMKNGLKLFLFLRYWLHHWPHTTYSVSICNSSWNYCITLTFSSAEHTFDSISLHANQCESVVWGVCSTWKSKLKVFIFFGRRWSNFSAQSVVHSLKRSSCRFFLALSTSLNCTAAAAADGCTFLFASLLIFCVWPTNGSIQLESHRLFGECVCAANCL